MTNYIKSRPWLYRGLRTFFQAFIGTVAAQMVIASEGELNEKIFLSILVSALAAGLAAVMNLGEKNKEEVQENDE